MPPSYANSCYSAVFIGIGSSLNLPIISYTHKHPLKNTNISYLALSQDHTLLPSLLESCIDPRSALQLLRLLGCVTAVCVEDWLLDGLSLPHTSPPLGTTSKPLTLASNTSTVNTSIVASSSTIQDINDLDANGTVPSQLDTPVITPTPTSDFINAPKSAKSDAASAASAASSTAHMWGRDDILSSLPWLRWRGVALTPVSVCEDLSLSQPNVSIPSDVFKLSQSEHQDITSNPGKGVEDMKEKEREREMKGDAKKGATMSSKLSFAQTEHTTQYRDEELEKEIDIALSRRIGKPGLKAIPKGIAFAARDAPCVLRRKVIPRSGPNRAQVITGRVAPQGDGHSVGQSDDHSSLKDGLALMLAANREALLEKRTYSMINRKPSLRNQMLARKEHSSPQESDSGEGNVLRIRRNYIGENVPAGNGQIRNGNGNGKTSADHRPLLQPLRKSLFQVSGPSLEFNPNDFVTSSTAVISGVSKKSDLRAVLGPGRIRGDWISALIAGGPPPGVKKRVDSGAKPASTPLPCTVTATSSSFKKKSSRDHNEDDFTAIEDGSELNLSSSRSLSDPFSTSTTHSKPFLEKKPPLALNAFRFPEKGRIKLSGGSSGSNPLKRSSTGFGKSTRQREGDKSGEKNTDFILALTVKKKRALDDVRANFPAPTFQTSLSGIGTVGAGSGIEAVTGSGAVAGTGTGSSGLAAKDLPSNSFIPWRSGNPDNNGGTKRIRHNPDNVNLTPISATHGTLPGLCPPLSSLPAITVNKSGNRFPPTFKVNPRPTPTPSQTSVPPFSLNQQNKDHDHLGWDDNNDRMEVDEPFMEGSGIPGYSLIQGDDMHSTMPLIDHEDLEDHSSHSPEESSKTLSSSHNQSSKEEGKTLTRRVGIPTARSMNSNSIGGVIVSGTLQRAKPGPKPRLQFTSDGDSNTVRMETIFDVM